MTATIDAIHAGELLGSSKFFDQMSTHRQKQGSQQAAAHRRAADRNALWEVPRAVGPVAEEVNVAIDHAVYVARRAFPISALMQTSEPWLSINGAHVVSLMGPQPRAWIVPVCSSHTRDGFSWLPTGPDPKSASIASRILSDIEALRDGWDGPESLAPTAAAKKTANSVVAQAAPYLANAEIEVDPTVGNPGFHWFSADQKSVISLTIQNRGGVVIVASSVDGASLRVSLKESELDKVGRALVDAGVGRLNDALR